MFSFVVQLILQTFFNWFWFSSSNIFLFLSLSLTHTNTHTQAISLSLSLSLSLTHTHTHKHFISFCLYLSHTLSLSFRTVRFDIAPSITLRGNTLFIFLSIHKLDHFLGLVFCLLRWIAVNQTESKMCYVLQLLGVLALASLTFPHMKRYLQRTSRNQEGIK